MRCETGCRDWAEVLENNAVLIVLDNLESLLTEAGAWRDERWGLLVKALLTPGGLSRTVLTSRTRPSALPDSTEVIAVHALPRDEALLLMRELPNLRRLLDGATTTAVSQEAGRQLVRRVLRLVQGHPKLIELAEALAANPVKLVAQLDEADKARTAGGGELDAFFAQGETRLDPAAFMASLHGWTRGIAGVLPEAARSFFYFLCALEEGDRQGWIIENNWSDVWQRLSRPAPTPALQTVLDPLVAAGLVDKQSTGDDAGAFEVLIHPGVAEAGRGEAGSDRQAAVDHELAATWLALFRRAQEVHGREAWAGPMLMRAGLHGFPYLARLRQWDAASIMLGRTVSLDHSTVTIAAVLPLVRRLVAATMETEREAKDRGLLARVLRFAGRTDDAEALLRELIAQTAGRGEFATASAISTDLANLLQHTGRPREALRVIEQAAEYTRQAGHGPWTQLLDEGQRLQIRNQLGEHGDVLAHVLELREQMRQMPDPPEANDWSVNTWNVREGILDVGREAALQLAEWQQALELSAEIIHITENRGAGDLEVARTRFNDYGPLLRLARFDDARGLLLRCRDVFEQENAAAELGIVFSGLADLEDKLGHNEAARSFEQTALRYKYAAVAPEGTSISHFNLANYLTRAGSDWRDVLAHRLASAMVSGVTGSAGLTRRIAALAGDLRRAGDQASAALPAGFAALCAPVQQVEGVRFRELILRLAPDEAALNHLLQDIIASAKAQTKGGAATMSQRDRIDDIARRSAARLVDIDPILPDQVEQALADDPPSQPAERVIDPISLGALVVSIASLGWTIWHDIRKDRAVAGLHQAGKTRRLTEQLQEAGPVPTGFTPQMHIQIIGVVAAEIVGSDPV